MKSIIWIASYPKSGNTWVRAFLTRMMRVSPDGFSINDLLGKNASSRKLFDEQLCIESSDLSFDEIDSLQPLALKSFAKDITATPYFMKVHDKFRYGAKGEAFFASSISIGAIYIVRNPLDVAVSYAHHNKQEVDAIIKQMRDEHLVYYNVRDRMSSHLPQQLSSWSGNIRSWLTQKEIPLLLIRYEDLVTNPLEQFGRILDFSGLGSLQEQLPIGIEEVSFESLQKQEEIHGFKEKHAASDFFFRKGVVGSWRDVLTDRQKEEIITDHREVMEELGYLINDSTVY